MLADDDAGWKPNSFGFGLVRLLYRRGWDRQRILDLFAVLDWMMRLPDVLERKLWQGH